MEQQNANLLADPSGEKQSSAADQEIKQHMQEYVNKEYRGVNERLIQLEKEWDIEQALELNAAGLTLAGAALGLLVDKRWLALSFLASAFLAQHALQGWCPPLPVLRRFGFRTRSEINREKYALKALRGDFRRTVNNPDRAWRVVNE